MLGFKEKYSSEDISFSEGPVQEIRIPKKGTWGDWEIETILGTILNGFSISTYQESDKEYTIEVPASWRIEYDEEQDVNHIMDGDKTVLTILRAGHWRPYPYAIFWDNEPFLNHQVRRERQEKPMKRLKQNPFSKPIEG